MEGLDFRRHRRLRSSQAMRGLVRETELTPAHLVAPLFVEEGLDGRAPIEAMPGQSRLGLAALVEEAGELRDAGVPAVLLFGIPAAKDERGSGAYDDRGVRAGGDPEAEGCRPGDAGDRRRVPVRVHEPRALRGC